MESIIKVGAIIVDVEYDDKRSKDGTTLVGMMEGEDMWHD